MKRLVIVLSLLMLLTVPFLTSCDSGGFDALVNWAKLWAMVHDITDTDGNVNAGAAARFAIGEITGFETTGDAEGDAAIDAARGVKNMLTNLRDAEKEADEGWDSLYSGKHVNTDVLPHYNKAIELRPGDWSYWNERGIAYLESIDISKADGLARKDFDKAAQLAKKAGDKEYLKMLKQREQAMARLVTHVKELHATPMKGTYEEQSRLYDELYKLTGENNYLLLKQQADTNLKEGFYGTRNY